MPALRSTSLCCSFSHTALLIRMEVSLLSATLHGSDDLFSQHRRLSTPFACPLPETQAPHPRFPGPAAQGKLKCPPSPPTAGCEQRADSCQSIPYDRLLSELQVQDVRQLEDLIIDVIYAGLLGGKMHHHERVLHVDWVAGRDLTEQDLLRAKEGLQNWSVLLSKSTLFGKGKCIG
jgi:hypothetical protein